MTCDAGFMLFGIARKIIYLKCYLSLNIRQSKYLTSDLSHLHGAQTSTLFKYFRTCRQNQAYVLNGGPIKEILRV